MRCMSRSTITGKPCQMRADECPHPHRPSPVSPGKRRVLATGRQDQRAAIRSAPLSRRIRSQPRAAVAWGPERNLGWPERFAPVPAICPAEAARSGSTDRTTLTMSTTTTARLKAPAPARPAQTQRLAFGGQRLGRSGAGSGGRLIAPGPHGPGHAGRAGPGRRQAGPSVPQIAPPALELLAISARAAAAWGRREISARLKDSGWCRPYTRRRPPEAARSTGPHS